jgi:hypothetical protein
MKYITLPPLTTKQKEIPPLIYRFRYINRLQFQKLTNELHTQNMNSRLKQLVDKKYLKSTYEKTQQTLYTPAEYCLGNIGINYLKTLGYDLKSLKKFYSDHKRKPGFIKKCLFIVDVYLTLLSDSKNSKYKFEFYTQADFIPTGPMKELMQDFGYVYETKNKVISYTAEIFDTLMSDGAVRFRVRRYFEFFAEEKVESHIIFICPTEHIYKIVSKQTRRLLEAELTEDNIHFSITTIERMRTGDIGEKIRI